jgi:hypothetical protein
MFLLHRGSILDAHQLYGNVALSASPVTYGLQDCRTTVSILRDVMMILQTGLRFPERLFWKDAEYAISHVCSIRFSFLL